MNNFSHKLDKYLSLSLKLAKKNKKIVSIALFVLILANILVFPTPGFAERSEEVINFDYKLIVNLENAQKLAKLIKSGDFLPEIKKEINHLPENEDLKADYAMNVAITAYNSEVGQCDDSPCITANGFNVCKHGKEDTVAINGIKFGTKIRIPELFGDKVFIVRDRMNSRYKSNRADIWMISRQDAVNFGVKYTKIEVLNS